MKTTASTITTTTTTTTADILTTPSFIKFTALLLISFSLFFVTHHLSSSSTTGTTTTPTSLSLSLRHSPLPPPPSDPDVVRMGIIDGTGAMSLKFEVGESYLEADDSAEDFDNVIGEGKETEEERNSVTTVGKYNVCDERLTDHIPCLDDEKMRANLSESQVKQNNERHCPKHGLNCLIPAPKGYQTPVTWPQSRDEVWISNLPRTTLANESGLSGIKVKDDKFIFTGSESQYQNGTDRYLDQISQMVPEIAFGGRMRVALDIGGGVGSFGVYLMQRNVTTMSIASKDIHDYRIQFALERGVPAMVAVFGTHRLSYPSQAFDFIHCSRCQINWTLNGGIFLLEANRVLRAGGYFIWVAEVVYKDEEILQGHRKEMEDLASRICWELVKEGDIAIWRKPLKNSCYLNRDAGVRPPMCDSEDDPDNVWYVGMKACISRLPENSYGANLTSWPTRLHHPPDRLQTIKLDADVSRKDIFRAESNYWNDVIGSYIRAFRWKGFKLRNVMDMRAGFGGVAAALHDLQIDCWVMNVVPVSGFNTLPVIYDRGLIGVMHDWCEPFDTYPRTYDLLHAAGLFSVEQKRCNISNIMLEMDRMLRPGGHVYIRDSVTVVDKLQAIATAIRWLCGLQDTSEGPNASYKILICTK